MLALPVSSGTITTAGSSASRIQHPHLASDGAYLTYAALSGGTINVSTKNLPAGTIARTTNDTSTSITSTGAFWQKPAGSPSFSITCSPNNLTLAKATTTTITCTVTSSNGFASSVTISTAGLTSGLSAEPFANSVTVPANGSVRFAMAVNARSTASLGTSAFQVNVAAAGTVKTSSVQLSVVATTPRVRLVYLVPSDKEPNAQAIKGMDRAIRHLQIWYHSKLATGKSLTISYPTVEVVRTPHSSDWYSTNPNGDKNLWFWQNTLADAFALTGGEFDDPNNIWLYYIDAETAQGQITGGTNRVAVLPGWDVRGVAGQEWEGICRWVGGLGHEMGHSLGLPHPAGCDDSDDGTGCQSDALMYLGYTTYPSAILTDNDKRFLQNSPFLTSRPVTTRLFGCASLESF